MGFLSKLFKAIANLFADLWKMIKKALPYIAIGLAIYFTFGGSFAIGALEFEGLSAAVAALGISVLIAPDETIDVVQDVAEAGGAVMAAAVGGVATGLFSGNVVPALAMGALCFLGYKLLASTSSKSKQKSLSGIEPSMSGQEPLHDS